MIDGCCLLLRLVVVALLIYVNQIRVECPTTTENHRLVLVRCLEKRDSAREFFSFWNTVEELPYDRVLPKPKPVL